METAGAGRGFVAGALVLAWAGVEPVAAQEARGQREPARLVALLGLDVERHGDEVAAAEAELLGRGDAGVRALAESIRAQREPGLERRLRLALLFDVGLDPVADVVGELAARTDAVGDLALEIGIRADPLGGRERPDLHRLHMRYLGSDTGRCVRLYAHVHAIRRLGDEPASWERSLRAGRPFARTAVARVLCGTDPDTVPAGVVDALGEALASAVRDELPEGVEGIRRNGLPVPVDDGFAVTGSLAFLKVADPTDPRRARAHALLAEHHPVAPVRARHLRALFAWAPEVGDVGPCLVRMLKSRPAPDLERAATAVLGLTAPPPACWAARLERLAATGGGDRDAVLQRVLDGWRARAGDEGEGGNYTDRIAACRVEAARRRLVASSVDAFFAAEGPDEHVQAFGADDPARAAPGVRSEILRLLLARVSQKSDCKARPRVLALAQTWGPGVESADVRESLAAAVIATANDTWRGPGFSISSGVQPPDRDCWTTHGLLRAAPLDWTTVEDRLRSDDPALVLAAAHFLRASTWPAARADRLAEQLTSAADREFGDLEVQLTPNHRRRWKPGDALRWIREDVAAIRRRLAADPRTAAASALLPGDG